MNSFVKFASIIAMIGTFLITEIIKNDNYEAHGGLIAVLGISTAVLSIIILMVSLISLDKTTWEGAWSSLITHFHNFYYLARKVNLDYFAMILNIPFIVLILTHFPTLYFFIGWACLFPFMIVLAKIRFKKMKTEWEEFGSKCGEYYVDRLQHCFDSNAKFMIHSSIIAPIPTLILSIVPFIFKMIVRMTKNIENKMFWNVNLNIKK